MNQQTLYVVRVCGLAVVAAYFLCRAAKAIWEVLRG